jgi:tetratricopeptide (TPR) repeat protein
VKGGRGPEAVEGARAIVASAPDDADAWFTLGLAQSEPDVNGALKTFQHVLDLAPRHALARYNLALILKRIDRTSEAIDELTRAVAIEPRPEAYYALGVIYWQQGEVERAVQALRAALAAEPRYADAYYTLGAVLAARHDWKGAAASLRRAIALRPDLWGARDTLARVLRQLGDESGAKTEVAESERLRRESELEHEAVVWTTTGTRQLEAGDAAGAAERFRRATQVFDRYAPAYYQLGRALDALGQHEAARAAFARARQLNARLVSPVETR